MKPIQSDIHVPAPLRDLQIFLCWQLEQRDGEPKPRKLPYYASGGKRYGKQGSPNDRRQLVTYKEAMSQAIKRGMSGIGIALLEGYDIVAIDLDNWLGPNGELPSGNHLLDTVLAQSYCERSPSGRGIRALFRGNLGNRKAPIIKGTPGCELFSTTGFVTLTGDHLAEVDRLGNSNVIADVTPALIAFVETQLGKSVTEGARPAQHDGDEDWFRAWRPALGLTVERMQELLAVLDPSMGRDDWIRVGMALCHETDGEDTGFELWDDWSAGGVQYPGTEELRKQWKSFKLRKNSDRVPITIASVIKMAKEASGRAVACDRCAANDPSIATQVMQISALLYHWRNPKTIPPRPWVFGRWLLRGTVACVVAPGGVGKSTFVSGMAVSCITGRSLLNKKVWERPQKVWLWNLEDDLDELSRTIQATCLYHVVAPSDVAGHLFVDSAMDGSELCTATEDKNGLKLLEPVYEAVCAEITRRGIDVLIIDPFVSSHAVEENSNSKIDKVVKAWGRVAKAANCVIVLVHHTSKVGAAEVTANSARGASALTSAARSVLTLNRMNAADAAKYGIPEDDRRRHFAVIDDKHNRAPAERDAWFQLLSIDLGNGDNVGVCVPWSPPAAPDVSDLKMVIALQKLVDVGQYRDNHQAKGWVGEAIAKVYGLDLNDQYGEIYAIGIQRKLKQAKLLAVERRRGDKGRDIPFAVVGIRIEENEGEDDLI